MSNTKLTAVRPRRKIGEFRLRLAVAERISTVCRKSLIVPVLLLLNLSPLAAEVYFKAGQDGFRFGNEYLERCFQREEDTWRTTWLTNKLTGHTWRTFSQEFRIRFTFERLGYWAGQENPREITADDCVLRGYRIEPQEQGVRRLAVAYHWDQGLLEGRTDTDRGSPGLEIEVTYTLAVDQPYLRKQIRVSSPGGKLYFIEELAVENMIVAGAGACHQGFGQPVYTEEMFFGLEYPAGNNLVRNSRLELFYYPGTQVGPEGLKSYAAVWGAAPWQRTRAAFLDYLKDIRVAPARPFLLYNTWYDMRTPERAMGIKAGVLDYKSSLARIESFRKNLVDHGIELNSFVLDEGWDRYTPYWEIDTRNFPGGFAKLAKALDDIGSSLGLWLGPIGGYGEGLRLRGEAGRKAGLEVSRKGYLDHAGPKYRRILTGRLIDYIRKYNVNYYKFDGMLFGYSGTDHGYLPGVYSREVQTASLIALLDTLHAVRPGIFTNITTSSWLSPWWLAHTDCVYMGGSDYGWLRSLPSISKRDLAISYRDKVCYDNFRDLRHQFPTNSIMTVGVIKGVYQYLGDPRETLDKWTNNLVMHFSRGLAMWELYISPQILEEEEWETLRAAVRWAVSNKDVLLANTTMVGGDPAEREPYGYFHFNDQKMILTLRNPYIRPATFRMPLDYGHGWLEPNDEVYLPLTVYPYRAVEQDRWLSYGKTIEVRLSGYQTKVIELLRRESVNFPVVRNVGFDFAPGGLTLYPDDRSEKAAVENTSAAELTIAGVPIPPGAVKEIPLEAAFPATGLEVEDRRSGEWDKPGLESLSGEISIRLPTGSTAAEVAFLLELDSALEGLEPVLSDNGTSLGYRTEEGERKNWYWFVAPLELKDSHRVAYEIPLRGATGLDGGFSCWLILHRDRPGHALTVPGIKAELAGRHLPAGKYPGTRRSVECLFDRPVRF